MRERGGEREREREKERLITTANTLQAFRATLI